MSMYQQSMVRAYMAWQSLGPWAQFRLQAKAPARAQELLLRRILRQNYNSEFGKAYHFRHIRTASDYIAQVPIYEYEGLRPWIDRQLATEMPVLTTAPFHHCLLTSGTTGEPKRIPLTAPMLGHLRDCQRLAAYSHFLQAPRLFSGRLLAITGAAIEGITPEGIPYGCLSGVLHDAMTRFMTRRSIPSAPIETQRYEAIAREAAAAPDITVAISANPSSFLRLKALLLQEGLLAEGQRLGDLWPDMQAVITWTGGNCATYIPALKHEFPSSRILEAGYLASELYGTIPLKEGICAPALGHYFFEFIPVEAWDKGERSTLMLHQLEQGQRYYVIVTNESGLYRYFMHDIVEVDGMFEHTPCLRFIQKGKGVTSLTGEKLYEAQLLQALQSSWDNGPPATFFLALAHTEPAHYRLYLEAPHIPADLAKRMDTALAALNIEYKAKRRSERLLPLQLAPLRPGAGDAYRLHCLDTGQREAQWKPLRLHYAHECPFDFTPYLSGPL